MDKHLSNIQRLLFVYEDTGYLLRRDREMIKNDLIAIIQCDGGITQTWLPEVLKKCQEAILKSEFKDIDNKFN